MSGVTRVLRLMAQHQRRADQLIANSGAERNDVGASSFGPGNRITCKSLLSVSLRRCGRRLRTLRVHVRVVRDGHPAHAGDERRDLCGNLQALPPS